MVSMKGSAIYARWSKKKEVQHGHIILTLEKLTVKRKKKEKGGFRTKKEAEQALTAAMNEYNNAWDCI